ncbi:MAG: glycosyltransferase family 2 protein [Rhodothermales bacterium]
MSRGPRRIGQKRGDNARLSLCMIVKNEAETLEKCLRTARPHVDEIVIVDTGSTDGSLEIARRYADVVDEITWPDSFSIARNHSFDLADGDFILVLDGDEYIESESEWQRLRKCLRDTDVVALQFSIKNLMPDDQIMAADRMWQTRVIKNHPRIRYTGRVHNQIDDAVKEYQVATGTRAIRVNCEVVHTGYALDPAQMKSKYAPRLDLLLYEYENPRSNVLRAYYGYQLGVVYYVMQMYEEAADVFNAIDYSMLTPQNAFYTHLLAAQAALKLKNGPMALIHCNGMLSLDQSEPVAFYTTGLALLMTRQAGDGMLMLLEAYNINEEKIGTIRFILNPAQMLFTLARICGQIGLKDHQRIFSALYEKGTFDTQVVKSLIGSLKTNIVLAEFEVAHA